MPRGKRFLASVGGRFKSLRSSPLLSPSALLERLSERELTPTADPGRPEQVEAALDWLARAQDAAPDDGIARGYSLTWNRVYRSRGWQPSYPEATGYIVPTLYAWAAELNRPDLARRAERAAHWEIGLQLPTGAVQAGVVGQTRAPSVFNTGQVMLGWLAAYEATAGSEFADAARRAGRFLVATLDPERHDWTRGNSPLALSDATRYNSRTAWILAEAGVRLQEPEFVAAAGRHLCAVVAEHRDNGWLPRCCLNDPERPLLHTLAYAVSGLLGGGLILENDLILRAARRSAGHLADTIDPRGWMSGRFYPDWSAAVRWSCLTGEAQMADVWLRFYAHTGEPAWLDRARRVLAFIEATRNLRSRNPGLRGGIKGSWPVDGEYGGYEILSWAVKFYLDAVLRYRWATRSRNPGPPPGASLLG
ncbi:MAG TPA: hypothetical protein VNH46_10050 [Gemmatimonadales bacterium]|nr:hypothetical protein [Gemmatimonadales bacterium]